MVLTKNKELLESAVETVCSTRCIDGNAQADCDVNNEDCNSDESDVEFDPQESGTMIRDELCRKF